MQTEDEVVLVDERDNVLGSLPKLQAHREGRLHRAISVFVFNSRGEMLLQRRASGKYHSGGLWTNACCSHPRPGEKPHQAAIRRLQEEMGVECALEYAFSFLYRAELDGGLTEHELDHVFVGEIDETPVPDPDEVSEWRWLSMEDVRAELEANPDSFTAWFPLAFNELSARRAGSARD